MDGLDCLSRFHDFCCSGSLVLKIRDLSNLDVPMDSLLSGLSLMVWISATCSQYMDDPDPTSLFQDFRFPDDKNPLSTQNPGSRYTDGSLNLCHVSQLMDGSDQFWDFHHENSQSHVIVTLDFTNVDIAMATPLVRTLPLLFTKSLTPVQLSTDPMAVGSLDQDPTVQFCSSCACAPAGAPWT
jgi:hypothetical protein